MYDDSIDKLRLLLSKENIKTVIIPHISPDGDAVGASSAWYQVLSKAGISSCLITCDYIPEYLRFLKNAPGALSYQDKAEQCKKLIADADIIFMMDHNTLKREGDLQPWVEAATGDRVIIDHHPDPDSQSCVISDPEVSSTCELLYDVIVRIWGREIIDADVANALYTGINTDTGGLSHNSFRSETYRIIADLLELGLDKTFVHEHIYQTSNLLRLRLVGHILLNKLQIIPGYPVAIMPVTKEELDTYHYKDGDLEGVVNVPLSMHKICISIQITERKDRVKLSFRSKGDIPVNEWAKAYFYGGGHPNAAGGQMDVTLEEVVKKVNETAAWFCDRYINKKM